MTGAIKEQVAYLTGQQISRLSPLSGGCIYEVYRVDLSDGERLVAKAGLENSGLEREGRMLSYLREHSNLPVPTVISATDDLLLMTYIEAGSSLDDQAQIHAADLLADLHSVTSDRFGFDWDTVIGGLHQPNPQGEDWIGFFAKHRLVHMARQGLDAGRLPKSLMERTEKFADGLSSWITPSNPASLIHGDMWDGNVLCQNGRIGGFVDPAIYYADPEIELAFATLFNTFDRPFFDRYTEIRPISPGFFEERRHIYNLYPLLVHVRLFGGSYVNSVDGVLQRFGY